MIQINLEHDTIGFGSKLKYLKVKVNNQYQQKSEVLYTFTPNKSYAYLLNVEPSNLVFLKTYYTEFDEIVITFMDQKGRLLEIEDKVNWTLFINK